MNHPYLLLISGPAGAGKSEFAERWASTRDHPCARISVDELWDSIKAGRVQAVDGWSEEHGRQHGITLDGAAALVANFLKNSISVVIDDVVFPNWPPSGLPAWRDRLAEIDLNMVVLMPSWEVIVQRNSVRSGVDNLPEKMLRKIYDDMQAWQEQEQFPVIDNSELTIEATIELAAQKLMK